MRTPPKPIVGTIAAKKKNTDTSLAYDLPEDLDQTIHIPSQVRENSVKMTASSRFEEKEVLGQGGTSTVCKVRDKLLHRQIARKELKPDTPQYNRDRFFEEAKIMASLDHPNIIPVHDIEMDDDGRPKRFTMKLVEGKTLCDALKAEDPESVIGKNMRHWLNIFLKICDAISFAHSRGVVHCDLKPSNVMVGTHGQVYVVDWGIAHLIKENQSIKAGEGVAEETDNTRLQGRKSSLSGTPAYMAPEQARSKNENINERTDIFGLGGLLYFMLTLRAPYLGKTVRDIRALADQGDIQGPQVVVKDRKLPPGLCRIAMRALSSDQASRYPTVDALMNEIEDFLRGGGWFETKHLPKGCVIVQEGRKANAAYIILNGTCEVHKNVDHKPQWICQLGEGEVFGETAIFGSQMRTATVTTSTAVSLIVVTREELEGELHRTEWLSLFVKAITRRLLEGDEKLRRLEAEIKNDASV